MQIKDKLLSVFKEKEGRIFQPEKIIDLVCEAFPDTNRTSVLPSDYCYNRKNEGINFQSHLHLFLSLKDESYVYLGPHFPYNGPVYWINEHVGNLAKGVYTPLPNLNTDIK
jgi:hypothetical protein